MSIDNTLNPQASLGIIDEGDESEINEPQTTKTTMNTINNNSTNDAQQIIYKHMCDQLIKDKKELKRQIRELKSKLKLYTTHE